MTAPSRRGLRANERALECRVSALDPRPFHPPLISRSQFLLHFALLERNVLRQPGFNRGLYLSLNQWLRIFHKFFIGEETVLANPVAGDEMLHVGDICQRLQ